VPGRTLYSSDVLRRKPTIYTCGANKKETPYMRLLYLDLDLGTPGAVSFEHLLAWLDQLRTTYEDAD
jgi:hypothetical protein